MDEDEPRLAVTLPPRPSYLALVRRVGLAFAGSLGVGEPTLADVQTVINEAFALALAGNPGGGAEPVLVEASRSARIFTIIVRDRGEGIRRATSGDGGHRHLGLRLISNLSHELRVSETEHGETELRMLLTL